MKGNTVFLFTSEFPFGTGENFIESEIKILANAFDKIFIIPFENPNGEQRRLPQNVSVKLPETHRTSLPKIFSKIFSEPEILKEFLKNLFSNPLKNKVLLNTVRNALTVLEQIELLRRKNSGGRHFFYSYWLNDAAVALAFLNDSEVKISRAHGWDVYFERHPYNYLPLRKFLAQKLNKIFTISENGKLYLDGKTDQPEKIEISRLGTINDFPFKDNIDDSRLNVISIGNLIHLKRVNLIGEAIKIIDHPKINWHHFGDGELFQEIKNKFPFGNFHGFTENIKIKEFLAEHSTNSVLINTSSTEGIPVSMMEAMSFGIPCIGTDVGGVSEIIEDNVNGFLMPADLSAEKAAEFINKYFFLSNSEKQIFRQNAYKTWKEKYNAEKNYRDFADKIKSNF